MTRAAETDGIFPAEERSLEPLVGMSAFRYSIARQPTVDFRSVF